MTHSSEMSTAILRRVLDEELHKVSPCRSDRPHNTSLHVAAIVKRGKVLAVARNRIGSRSTGSGYSNQTLHAEKAVFKKLGDIRKLNGAVLCVWRLGSTGVMPSKPCSECQLFLEKCIREYGLRAVQYTDSIMPME